MPSLQTRPTSRPFPMGMLSGLTLQPRAGSGLVSAEAPNKHTDYHQNSPDVQNGWNARSLSFSNSLPKEDLHEKEVELDADMTAGVFILRIDGVSSVCPPR